MSSRAFCRSLSANGYCSHLLYQLDTTNAPHYGHQLIPSVHRANSISQLFGLTECHASATSQQPHYDGYLSMKLLVARPVSLSFMQLSGKRGEGGRKLNGEDSFNSENYNNVIEDVKELVL